MKSFRASICNVRCTQEVFYSLKFVINAKIFTDSINLCAEIVCPGQTRTLIILKFTAQMNLNVCACIGGYMHVC
jgi:hypothetical protein